MRLRRPLTMVPLFALFVWLAVQGAWIVGCATETSARAGRAATWSAVCGRCHDTRSPSTLSDGEWDVVVHHMRVRAYLSPDEQRLISQFLNEAN